jgi:hypothetical protein
MTQAQREALIDLLHLAILADVHISLKEDEGLASAITSLGWESTQPREIYILTSGSKARRAIDTAETSDDFLKTRAAQFDTAESQQQALELLRGLFASDGTSADESAFLSKLSAAFA